MTLEDAFRDLATAESELPRAAMQWALEHESMQIRGGQVARPPLR